MSNKYPDKKQVHFDPKNTLQIIWKVLFYERKANSKESIKGIKTEEAARKVLSRLQVEKNIASAIWYNNDRQGKELIKKKQDEPIPQSQD